MKYQCKSCEQKCTLEFDEVTAAIPSRCIYSGEGEWLEVVDED